jgi:glycosyltransferase involved in cell wall biosynthesis
LPGKLTRRVKRFLERYQLYVLAREVKLSLKTNLGELNRIDRRVATLRPEGSPRGNVLFSYISSPFFLKPGEPIPNTHTHFWESMQMARTFVELGYCVDAIHWLNRYFIPEKEYDFFVDARLNLERLAPRLGKHCVKIMHIETAHWLTHGTAQHTRLLALQRRRGVTLRPVKIVEPNSGIEHADCATILGNAFTIGTYRYAGKPLYRIPISTPVTYPWPEGKDFEACRRRWVWFGSGDLVHKGLDLVLEAFVQMPDYHLTVCGPVQREPAFEKAFYKELYQTPNIRTLGWVDIDSREFVEMANGCVGVVYPSCSEGGGGGVITCMHAGLIPIVTRQTSVDVSDEYGAVLPGDSIDDIQRAVRRVSELPADRLRSMARQAWEFAQAHHTRERFAEEYRRVISAIVAARRERVPAAMSLHPHPSPLPQGRGSASPLPTGERPGEG